MQRWPSWTRKRASLPRRTRSARSGSTLRRCRAGSGALPKHTEQIFHARPCKFEPGNPTPTAVEPEFLRTGLLGTVIEGKIFVLGPTEDRIRQKVEWVEHGTEIAEHRYFFVQHIVISIMRNVPKIFDCSAFDVYVNEEHLPIVVLESQAASTAPATSGGPPRQLDTPLLDALAERCMEVLVQEHNLRVYCTSNHGAECAAESNQERPERDR